MGFLILIVIVGVVAWYFLKAAALGMARHGQAEQRAVTRIMDEMDDEPSQKPTWAHDREKLGEFAHAVGRLSERRGVPLEYYQHFLAENAAINRLMHYMAILQRRGGTFAAQEIAAADYILGQWFLIPISKQGEFMSAELNRKMAR